MSLFGKLLGRLVGNLFGSLDRDEPVEQPYAWAVSVPEARTVFLNTQQPRQIGQVGRVNAALPAPAPEPIPLRVGLATSQAEQPGTMAATQAARVAPKTSQKPGRTAIPILGRGFAALGTGQHDQKPHIRVVFADAPTDGGADDPDELALVLLMLGAA